MKKIYCTPEVYVFNTYAMTIIASSITSVSVDGDESSIIVDNTTTGDASGALVKSYSVWDDDWNE